MLFFHRNEDATSRLMKLQDDEDAEKQFNEHFIHENRVKIADHECRKNISCFIALIKFVIDRLPKWQKSIRFRQKWAKTVEIIWRVDTH